MHDPKGQDHPIQSKVKASSVQSEEEFYRLWKDERLSYLEPAAMAFRGGRLAATLSGVFIAGYQAALRHVFTTLPHDGWTAFAVSENRTNIEANPPSALMINGDQGVLIGTKSWIAASAHVDYLLVLASEDHDGKRRKHCVLVDPGAPGVELTHRDAPKFLANMSQGAARFENVDVDMSQSYDEDQARSFGDAEPPFIMLASTGFLLDHLGERFPDLKDALLDIATGLSALCQAGSWTAKRLAYFDRKLQASIDAFVEVVDCDALPDWDADKMLLSMYSKKLQKAAQQ